RWFMISFHQTQGKRILYSRILVTVLLLGASLLSRPALAQITPNFVEAEIRSLISAVGEATGKTFIVDPRVTGKVTLTSSVQMTADEFYETFLSVLEVHDFVAQSNGGVIKIVPSNNARQMPGNDLPRTLSGPSDDMVTHVIKIRNISAAQLVPILRPLVPQYGHLVAVPPSNMLIISDRLANVNRLVRIVNRIDQAGEDEIDVIPLEHASAGELVRVITALNQGSAQAGGGAATPAPTVVADDRTNSILISGDSSSRLKLKTLVAHLDTPLEEGGDTQVIYLHYASAEELAQRLNDQASASEQQQQGGGQAAPARQSQTTIWADPETNALVITAPPKIMRNLKQVIDRLDIRRAQVQVEAIIAELSVEDSAALGVTWAVDGSDSNVGVGVTNFPNTSSSVGSVIAGGLTTDDDGGINFDTSAAVTALGGVPSGVTAAFGRITGDGTSFAAILNALRADGSTNILSTPTITTMDNQEATINVGQEVPFQTGSFTNTGGNNGAINPFSTIQREDVGINLKVTPRINEANSVILEIELESSSIAQGAAAATGASDLITNKRTITNNVIVEDDGIIVLGGLMDEQLLESDQRVPVLGRIPLLGNLFRSRTTDIDKRNLMVFIKPKILRDGMSTAIETNAKYNFMRDMQIKDQERNVGLIRGAERPVLPELTEKQKELAVTPPDENKSTDTEQPDEQPDTGN
ncbi:MAG: type II secretion system secretin GspD, partial [Pseudomonadota bacterium]